MARKHHLRTHSQRRRGVSLIYATLCLTLLLGVAALGVDFGVVMLERGRLQTAVDAATLHGVTGLDISPAEARRRVRQSLADNPVQGRVLEVDDEAIEFGMWDPKHRQFVPLPKIDAGTATAMRLKVKMSDGQNGRVHGFAGAAVGLDEMAVSAHAVATRGEPFDLEVQANSSPYLAGMPAGTKVKYTRHKHKVKDKHTGKTLESRDTVAGQDDPMRVPLTVRPGQVLYFREVRGGTGDWSSGGEEYGLDGNTDRGSIGQTPVNGYDTTRAPLNAMMGVFLKEGQRPDQLGWQKGLDFSKQEDRDFDTLRPEKKQIFFIGDGVNNRGRRLQRFVVPDGCDTLYLGLQDEYGWWWDNFGSVSTTMFAGKVRLVD